MTEVQKDGIGGQSAASAAMLDAAGLAQPTAQQPPTMQ